MSSEYPKYMVQRITVDLPEIFKSHPGLDATIQQIENRKGTEIATAARFLALTGRNDIIAEAIETELSDVSCWFSLSF